MSDQRPLPRRRAARRVGHLGSGLAAAVVLALSAAAVLVSDTAPPVTSGPPQDAGTLLSSAALACPGVRTGTDVSTRFVIGSAPVPGLSGSGRIDRTVAGQTRGTQLVRGHVRDLPGPARVGLVVRAEGAGAPGLFGARVDIGRRTLGVVPCAAPRATWWFTGAGATLDHGSTLVISNVDVGPAVVDIHVFGSEGRLPTPGTDGRTLAPGSRTMIRLSDVVPHGDGLAVSVTAHRGRVTAAVADSFADRAGAPPGRDWLPSQERPSRVLRFSSMPPRADRRTLLVANPSEREAVVGIQVAGDSGTFTPAGLHEVRVPAGTVVSTDVTKFWRGTTGALRLESQVRVVAALRSVSGADTTYTPVVGSFGRRAAVSLPRRTHATVSLTSGGLPGRARLTVYDAEGATVRTEQVDVPAATTVSWSTGDRGAYLVAETTAGSLHGAVTFTGPGLSQVPLLRLPVRLAQVRVRPAP